MPSKFKKPTQNLGFGLGLRTDHYGTILETKPKVDWFEILSENYMIPGGKPIYYLDKIRQDYPMVMHGVSMSLGSYDPLNLEYLKDLKDLINRVQPEWVSDHLCWTGINHLNTHDLLPLPYTEEALTHVVDRIKRVQDYLGRQILIENPSSYLTFNDCPLTEWDFMSQMAIDADCLILLDINNIYVSSFNHGFSPIEYLNNIPVDRVQQHHLAGHSNLGTHIIDTHDETIVKDVWDLYELAVKRFGNVACMIERDDNIPPLKTLLEELEIAKRISKNVLEGCAA